MRMKRIHFYKNTIRRLLNVVIIIGCVICSILGFQNQKGSIAERDAIFWVSLIASIVVLCHLAFSFIFKETVAKGWSITQDKNPALYAVSISVAIALLMACIFGIYYSW